MRFQVLSILALAASTVTAVPVPGGGPAALEPLSSSSLETRQFGAMQCIALWAKVTAVMQEYKDAIAAGAPIAAQVCPIPFFISQASHHESLRKR
jgi:hypothetical protein